MEGTKTKVKHGFLDIIDSVYDYHKHEGERYEDYALKIVIPTSMVSILIG